MTPSPYQSPQSVVSDPVVPTPPKPRQIQQTLRILWLLFVVDLIFRHTWFWDGLRAGEALGVSGNAARVFELMLPFLLVWSTLKAGSIWLIGKRHGWARWILLALVAVDAWALPGDVMSASETKLEALFDVSYFLLHAWCCYRLLIGAGSQWFRRIPRTT